jgi:ribosome-associated protein YbcJ (S4-like RNA binding protein)
MGLDVKKIGGAKAVVAIRRVRIDGRRIDRQRCRRVFRGIFVELNGARKNL